MLSNNRRIYLLPNILTTSGLLAGFYAIIMAIQNYYIAASIAIFIAMVFDGIDGRVARLTNTQSVFGAEYDSLSDMVSFGIAPAILLYNWMLMPLGKIGWLVAFCYAMAACLRLARFNAERENTDKYYFRGLPSPAAAAWVASVVWLSYSLQLVDDYGLFSRWSIIILTLFIASLMVSNVRYYSFKALHFKSFIHYKKLFLIMLAFVIFFSNPPLLLCIGFTLFALSGPIITYKDFMATHKHRLRRRRKVRNF